MAAFKYDVTSALAAKTFMRWTPEIQNTVAPIPPKGGADATDSLKTTRKSPLRLHPHHREAPNGIVPGGTSARFYILPMKDILCRDSNINIAFDLLPRIDLA